MQTDSRGVEVRDLGHVDRAAAVAVIARGMEDNPIHLAAYRGDAAWRRRAHGRVVGALVAASPSLHLLGAARSGALVAVAGSAPPGTCQPTGKARLRLLTAAVSLGPATASRLVRWNAGWARHDPEEPHMHLGPVAVDAGLRGHGLGGLLLREHVRRLDAVGAVGFLETDRPRAVGFYERFGYVVVEQADVLGVPCWFMRRPAAS
ncbi:GNAT family N-acetyltransferase [Lysobacter korlensis]|uniref:GNAT family N-acetyltransferase n=1 Tax=Lysobacter korlensis TaxID=553636 RepID=A0ABV6RUF6_9GAMM